jgi:xenotropic and polytropic retrovirus receptor 1
LVIVIAFSCRLLLALRLGYEEGFFCTRHILNTFKVLSALLSSILAFLYPQHPHLLIFWIVFSSVSTIYSHILDLKLDWDLL